MKVVIQTRQYTDGEYKGVVYEKVIPCSSDYEVKRAIEIVNGKNGSSYQILETKYYEDFDPQIYSKTAKRMNFDELRGS